MSASWDPGPKTLTLVFDGEVTPIDESSLRWSTATDEEWAPDGPPTGGGTDTLVYTGAEATRTILTNFRLYAGTGFVVGDPSNVPIPAVVAFTVIEP
jgi:hypothetical protein